MRRALGYLAAALMVAFGAAVGTSIGVAFAERDWTLSYSNVLLRGYASAPTEGETSVGTGAGGTACPTTALSNRGRVDVAVDYSETDYVYCSVGGTPTTGASGNWSFSLTGDQTWTGRPGSSVIKCISTSGTVVVHTSEWAQ